MRLGLLLLACGLTTGCGGGQTPSGVQAQAPSPEGSSTTQTAPAATPAASGEPTAGELVGVECKGTVLTSRESPQNKRDPSKGGHWIVELEVEEWSASDASTKPAEPVRLIVPRPVALALATPPAVGERFEVRANLVDGPTVTARVETLSPLDG